MSASVRHPEGISRPRVWATSWWTEAKKPERQAQGGASGRDERSQGGLGTPAAGALPEQDVDHPPFERTLRGADAGFGRAHDATTYEGVAGRFRSVRYSRPVSTTAPKTAQHKSVRFRRAVMVLGRRVRALREAKRWTVERAAERMAMEPANLRRIEGARTNPTLAVLVSVAAAFGLHVSDLLAPEGPPDPSSE